MHRAWAGAPAAPKKILALRFHAFGDVVITLPYLQALKDSLPGTELHLLTREECADIPRHAPMFAEVHALDDRRSARRLAALSVMLMPALLRERYDAVLDLQRNHLTRAIRRALAPASFSEFDRFSPLSAGERVRRTIDALGLAPLPLAPPKPVVCPEPDGQNTWTCAGYSGDRRYVVLNPAGSAATKNWPIANYERFARLWMSEVDADASFLILGTDRLAAKAEFLRQRLGGRVVDLVNRTTATEAFMLVGAARFVLTEDSALMHMAWTSGAPLVALFGSTPSVWSAPLGARSLCLDSSDLACGACDSPHCRFGDVHCLTRFTPEIVLASARTLLEGTGDDVRGADML